MPTVPGDSPADNPPQLPPPMAMAALMGGFQVSQALYVVAKLGVPTLLDERPMTVAELAKHTGAHAPVLRRLIRTLSTLGVFTTDGDTVRTTELGTTLSRESTGSLYHAICYWMETHYLPFSELLTTATTGQPAAERYLRRPFFDWIEDDPQRAELQSLAMAEVTGGLRAGMFEGYQLPPGHVVADIGGADGSVLIELLHRHPDRRGIVFDRPAIVPAADSSVARAGLGDRVTVVSGDFFDAVPTADIYVLGYILHDWNDDSATRILRTIARAARPGARLLLIEGIVPPGDLPHLTKMIDLTMLGIVTGRERTEQEYRDVLAGAGFAVDRVVQTATPFSIVEATVTT